MMVISSNRENSISNLTGQHSYKNINKNSITKGDNTVLDSFKIRHPWWTGLLIYIPFIFASIGCDFLFSDIVFGYFHVGPTDVNSARYLVSALIQSQAAIIAIVITLTLVVIQLAASTYSPRIANIFSQNPHLFLILGIYIASIGYGAIILQLITGIEGSISPFLQFWVSLPLWLTIFLAIALIPYINFTLESLNSENLTKKLISEITKNSLLSIDETGHPLDSVFDIIHRSIMKYDVATVRECFKILTPRIIEFISTDNTDNENCEIAQRYCDHLSRCSGQAGDLRDEEFVRIIIENVSDIAKHTSNNGFDNPTNIILKGLYKIEIVCIEKELSDSLNDITELLEEIGIVTIKKDLTDSNLEVMLCLEKIGIYAIKKFRPFESFNPYYSLIYSVTEILNKITITAIRCTQWGAINNCLSYLFEIGQYALNKEDFSTAEDVAQKLLELWREAILNETYTENISSRASIFIPILKKEEKKANFVSSIYHGLAILEIGILSTERELIQSQNWAIRLFDKLLLNDEEDYRSSLKIVESGLSEEKRKHLKKFLDLAELKL